MIIQFYLYLMITSEATGQRHSKSGLQKYIFNCKAYRLDGSTWNRLDKIFIDNQFDSKNSKGLQKVKIKGQRGFESTFIVKVTYNDKDFFYSMTQELQLHWFVHIVQTKLLEALSPPPSFATDYVNVCAGTILKKSNFLGEWEKCYVTITPEGLSSAQDDSSKPDLLITQTKEIWTRFELIEKNSFLVFKLRNFFKYEFGAPVESIPKWTKAFYSLIRFD